MQSAEERRSELEFLNSELKEANEDLLQGPRKRSSSTQKRLKIDEIEAEIAEKKDAYDAQVAREEEDGSLRESNVTDNASQEAEAAGSKEGEQAPGGSSSIAGGDPLEAFPVGGGAESVQKATVNSVPMSTTPADPPARAGEDPMEVWTSEEKTKQAQDDAEREATDAREAATRQKQEEEEACAAEEKAAAAAKTATAAHAAGDKDAAAKAEEEAAVLKKTAVKERGEADEVMRP